MRSTEQMIWFGKYRVLRMLGEGASSQVYLVEHLKLQTYRAMKRISKAHPLLSQFRLEANLLKSFHHPSIPIIYDLEEDEQYLYIVEEYVEGESLQEYLIYHNTISQEYILQLGIRICDDFAYLHSRRPNPVCYRDLKPEHIIVCGNSVKIIDFGIAVYMTDQEKNDPMGTAGYAAPEQYTDDMLTPAADIYALGMVLQQMERRGKNCSSNLHRIIQKATEKELQKRYDSAARLREALEQERKRICRTTGGKSHLYTHIAVAGAGRGVGATHIAFAMTAYLNDRGYSCAYQSKHERNPLEALIRENDVKELGEGVYQNEAFYGILKDEDLPEGCIHVMDFGDELDACIAEEAELTVLVVAGSAWRREEAWRGIGKAAAAGTLAIVCNQGSKESCIKYADVAKRKIYCFPEDKQPFVITPEKRKVFEKLLQMKKNTRISDKSREERRHATFLSTWRR